MSSQNNDQEIPFKGIYRVIFTAKRKPGVTKNEFSRRFALHGKMAAPVVVRHNGSSYIQNHLLDSHAVALKEKLGPAIAQHLGFADTDGITTLVFSTVDDLANFFCDPAHEKSLNADVAEFADVSTVNISLGDDLPVVENGQFSV